MLYRRLPNRNILAEMDRIQREMSGLFNAAYPARHAAPGFPAMNLWSGEDSVIVTAELPGISSEDIDIHVAGETLTIKGQRSVEALPEGAFYHRQERGFGKFSRTIELPFPVDTNQVSAALHDGVLTVELPRAEADKPRKISVGTAQKTMASPQK